METIGRRGVRHNRWLWMPGRFLFRTFFIIAIEILLSELLRNRVFSFDNFQQSKESYCYLQYVMLSQEKISNQGQKKRAGHSSLALSLIFPPSALLQRSHKLPHIFLKALPFQGCFLEKPSKPPASGRPFRLNECLRHLPLLLFWQILQHGT